MTFDVLGPTALDYSPCRYGTSKLLFRGPRRDLEAPFVAFLGGTETYGKFVPDPFVDLLHAQLGIACANFGCVNSGPDVYLNDPCLLDAAAESRITVLQVPGAQNISNRFYSVHPRRNDRFVAASKLLISIFPEVDFTNFHFNKHMLSELRARSEERYWIVEQELREAWLARMRGLIERLSGRVVLVWISRRAPNDTDQTTDPMHVTGEMIDQIRPLATGYVEVTLSESALRDPLDGMVFSQIEALAAREMIGPKAHAEIADKLRPVLKGLI